MVTPNQVAQYFSTRTVEPQPDNVFEPGRVIVRQKPAPIAAIDALDTQSRDHKGSLNSAEALPVVLIGPGKE